MWDMQPVKSIWLVNADCEDVVHVGEDGINVDPA